MDSQISINDLNKIEAGIRQKYSEVAKSPEGQFQYPTGRKGLETLNYDKTLIAKLPDAVASSYCGVGNPFLLGKINERESVLDIGCGTAAILNFLPSNVAYTGYDINSAYINYAIKNYGQRAIFYNERVNEMT